ncbi:MAG: SGNH/GDSL hydrolase family protein, partial [Actinobacteria bacterium]|nr:SGNH/GDSL hydrolase family protein [Actinomycetota bacterium]
MTMQQARETGGQVRELAVRSRPSPMSRWIVSPLWGKASLAALLLVLPVVGVAFRQAILFPRRFVAPPALAAVDLTVEPSTPSVADAPVVEMAAFGDSAMAGVGVHRLEDVLPVQLAQRVADATGRPVHVVGYARSGARTIDVLTEQLPLARDHDVSVLVVGTNDVTGVTAPTRLAQSTRALLDALESVGAAVVMSTLPRFRAMRLLPHPLMEVAIGYGALVSAVQRRAVARRPRVRLVDVGLAVGPEYFNDAGTLSADAFHPSAAGYARIADALVPAVLAVLESAGSEETRTEAEGTRAEAQGTRTEGRGTHGSERSRTEGSSADGEPE